jgi:membrane protein implicated in regulation of membrane protease activity
MSLWILWLLLATLLLIVELATFWITTLCFAVGSLAAMVASLCGLSLTTQLFVLGAAALVTFYLCGSKMAELQRRRADKRALDTNVDALIGRECQVIEEISDLKPGRVKVDGDNWQAICTGHDVIPVGTWVKITAHESIIMTVKPINTTQTA